MLVAIKEKNAVIESASLGLENGFLSAWLSLEYGDSSGQGFGGFMLYAGPRNKQHLTQWNIAGHFIQRVLEVAGVDQWSKLQGRSIRVRAEHSRVHAIGHIVKDDWFEPGVDFKKYYEAEESNESK